MMEKDKKQEQKRQKQLGTVSGLLFYRNFAEWEDTFICV